jgi:DNA-binding CsgD family transcriptional regulator
LKPAQVEVLTAGYRAGRSMQELAGEFGIDRRTVSTYLRRAGSSFAEVVSIMTGCDGDAPSGA